MTHINSTDVNGKETIIPYVPVLSERVELLDMEYRQITAEFFDICFLSFHKFKDWVPTLLSNQNMRDVLVERWVEHLKTMQIEASKDDFYKSDGSGNIVMNNAKWNINEDVANGAIIFAEHRHTLILVNCN